jgi:hypothetical protein
LHCIHVTHVTYLSTNPRDVTANCFINVEQIGITLLAMLTILKVVGYMCVCVCVLVSACVRAGCQKQLINFIYTLEVCEIVEI